MTDEFNTELDADLDTKTEENQTNNQDQLESQGEQPLTNLIDKKDVRVFLNFTWKGDSFQIEEIFEENEFKGNITDTLMKILNHGVGYVLVPEGELPEVDPTNTIEIVQTIKLDYQNNIDIETIIIGAEDDTLHPDDIEYLAKIDQRTREIVMEIFKNMEEEFMRTTNNPLGSVTENLKKEVKPILDKSDGVDNLNEETTMDTVESTNIIREHDAEMNSASTTMKPEIISSSVRPVIDKTIVAFAGGVLNKDHDLASHDHPRAENIIKLGQKTDDDNNIYFELQLDHQLLTEEQAKKAKNIIIDILMSAYGEEATIKETFSEIPQDFEIVQVLSITGNKSLTTDISETKDESETLVFKEIFAKIDELLLENISNTLSQDEGGQKPDPSFAGNIGKVVIVSIQSPFDIEEEDLNILETNIKTYVGITTEVVFNASSDVLLSKLDSHNNSIFIDVKLDSNAQVSSNFFQNKISDENLDQVENHAGPIGLVVNEQIKDFLSELKSKDKFGIPEQPEVSTGLSRTSLEQEASEVMEKNTNSDIHESTTGIHLSGEIVQGDTQGDNEYAEENTLSNSEYNDASTQVYEEITTEGFIHADANVDSSKTEANNNVETTTEYGTTRNSEAILEIDSNNVFEISTVKNGLVKDSDNSISPKQEEEELTKNESSSKLPMNAAKGTLEITIENQDNKDSVNIKDNKPEEKHDIVTENPFDKEEEIGNTSTTKQTFLDVEQDPNLNSVEDLVTELPKNVGPTSMKNGIVDHVNGTTELPFQNESATENILPVTSQDESVEKIDIDALNDQALLNIPKIHEASTPIEPFLPTESSAFDKNKESPKKDTESVDLDKDSVDLDKESVDLDKESVDLDKESVGSDKGLVDPDKESVDTGKESVDPEKESFDPEKESVDPENESVDPERESVDPAKGSVDHDKESVNPDKESVDQDKESVDTGKESVDLEKESVDPEKESVDPEKESIDPYKDSVDNDEETVDETVNKDEESVDRGKESAVKNDESDSLSEPLLSIKETTARKNITSENQLDGSQSTATPESEAKKQNVSFFEIDGLEANISTTTETVNNTQTITEDILSFTEIYDDDDDDNEYDLFDENTSPANEIDDELENRNKTKQESSGFIMTSLPKNLLSGSNNGSTVSSNQLSKSSTVPSVSTTKLSASTSVLSESTPVPSVSTLRTIISTSKIFNLEQATAPTPPEKETSKLNEKIIETLAKLFVKTLHLSIKIKSAIDKNSGNELSQNIVEIVSRNDDNEVPFVNPNLPNLIMITPEDAIEIRNDDEDYSQEETQPVVILIEGENNFVINATNGNILELDFSDLPTDPIERERIIRLKIRDLVQDIFLPPNQMETKPETSLSDEIIKNITQIVLSKMEESFKLLPPLIQQQDQKPIMDEFETTEDKSAEDKDSVTKNEFFLNGRCSFLSFVWGLVKA